LAAAHGTERKRTMNGTANERRRRVEEMNRAFGRTMRENMGEWTGGPAEEMRRI